jgi:hypothetical protein
MKEFLQTNIIELGDYMDIPIKLIPFRRSKLTP